MALQVWLPLIDTNIDNQGILHLSSSINGSVSTRSDGILGPSVLIGSSSTDANSRIRYTPDLDLAEVLGSKQTVTAWVKPDGDHSNYAGTIVSSGNWNILTGSWMFGLNKTNTQVSVFSRGDNRLVNCVVPTGSWTHLACTRDGNTGVVSLYKNGEFVTSSTQPTGSLTSTNDYFSVGLAAYAAWCPFNGLIQDVRIYDDILSAREIQEISKGLVVHYPLNDPQFTNSKIYDCSGYGNHGTPGGTLTTSEDSARYKRSTTFTNTSYIRCLTRPVNLPKDAITVNLWMNFSTFGSPISCTEGGGWNFENASNLRFLVYISGVGYILANSGVNVSTLANSWHMLTGIFDGTNVKIYIDGELKGSTPTNSTNGIGYANNWLFLAAEAAGNSVTPTSQAFVGKMSDVRIYATALSDDQVRELYNNPISVCKSGNLMCMEVVEP